MNSINKVNNANSHLYDVNNLADFSKFVGMTSKHHWVDILINGKIKVRVMKDSGSDDMLMLSFTAKELGLEYNCIERLYTNVGGAGKFYWLSVVHNYCT